MGLHLGSPECSRIWVSRQVYERIAEVRVSKVELWGRREHSKMRRGHELATQAVVVMSWWRWWNASWAGVVCWGGWSAAAAG